MQDLFDRMICFLPDWLRWVLFVPAAFLGDFASQSIGHLLFLFTLPQSLLPYGDEFIWRVWAPAMFAFIGTKIAPRHWFYVMCLLLGMKSVVAIINIRTLLTFWYAGGTLTEPAIVTNAPIWWSIVVHLVFVAFAVLIVRFDRNIRKERTDAYPVWAF